MTKPAVTYIANLPGADTRSCFQRFSTLRERADRRFDYWRSLHPNVDLDAIESEGRKDFKADLLCHAAPDGTVFGMTSNDDVVAHFAKPDREFVLFSVTVSGSARLIRPDGAERVVSPQDGLLVVDSTHPIKTISRGHEHLYLSIPRARVLDALNKNTDALRDGFVTLKPQGITELLRSHLLATAKEAGSLDEEGAAAAVKCGVDLALESLSQTFRPDGGGSGDSFVTFHAAARRLIQLHFSDSNLTTERVADGLGCSRAHLYRAFAQQGEQVGEAIRLARLDAASRLLASSSMVSIKQVAHACGFDNASSFTRAFRDFTGMTPSAFREMRARKAASGR